MIFRHLSLDYCLGFAGWIAVGVVAFVVLLKLRRRWKEKPKRLLLVKFGLSLWMLLFLLTLIEVYFATIYDQSDSFNATLVSQKWFKLHVEPDQKALMLGEEGIVYRDNQTFPETIPPEKHHICFIGDSFCFGHGVPNVGDRFSNRVRDSLSKQHPDGFIVTNLANAGQNLNWVEVVLKKLYERKTRVDTVVYVMCLNDIEVYHPDRNKLYEVELPKIAPRFFLFRHSYFLNFAYFRYKQFSHPQVRGYYSFVKKYFDGKPWETMQSKLAAVNKLCAEHGTSFRVVVFPFLHNLREDYPFRAAHKKIDDWCDSAKVPVLDLDPVLTPHVDEGLTVNRFDAHPNERAHELAAGAILKSLLKDVTNKPIP